MGHEESEPNSSKLSNLSTAKDAECQEQEDSSIETSSAKPEPLYCVLSEWAKILTICTCSMIFQAVSPLLTAGFSDQNGRRPVIITCLFIFIGTSIGLACQTKFPILLVLRCLQGFASSSAVVISTASVNDLVTRAERGKYMLYTSLGVTLGPAIGPTLGGILTQYLGWRSVFWFLAICSSVVVSIMLLFLPETSRAVVGNGSLHPQPWNRWIRQTLTMLLDAHVALLVICSAANTFTSSAITNSLTTLLAANYKLIPLHIGLCYLPFTFGGLSSRWTAGTIADWLYRRQAHQIGEDIQPNRQSPEQLERMPLEKARLRLTIPFVYFCCVCIVGYGWVMNYNVHLAGPLILLFFYGNATTGVSSTIAILAVDLNASRPASTHAAMNLVSYLTSAGAVAAVVPLIDNTGVGWMGVIMAGVMIVTSPALWALYIWGKAWKEKPSPKTCK
ncbi:hypothetical protein MYU51_001187 [Penicillium brevicompactum]